MINTLHCASFHLTGPAEVPITISEKTTANRAMNTNFRHVNIALALTVVLAADIAFAQDKTISPGTREITRAVLLDRIYGGWAGMWIGGIEGLPHEFKYKEQPRATLPDFTELKIER